MWNAMGINPLKTHTVKKWQAITQWDTMVLIIVDCKQASIPFDIGQEPCRVVPPFLLLEAMVPESRNFRSRPAASHGEVELPTRTRPKEWFGGKDGDTANNGFMVLLAYHSSSCMITDTSPDIFRQQKVLQIFHVEGEKESVCPQLRFRSLPSGGSKLQCGQQVCRLYLKTFINTFSYAWACRGIWAS